MDYNTLAEKCNTHTQIPLELYTEYDVKKGLRDINGVGVMAGLTNISTIISTETVDGVKRPCDGVLLYRGMNIKELVGGLITDNRLGYEEIAYLLLFGELPDIADLAKFKDIIAEARDLPKNFVREIVMKAATNDIMNTLARSVLTLASYDERCDDLALPNVLTQCIKLIGVMPMLAVYGYHAYNHYKRDESMYIHNPDDSLSAAENILRMLRPDKSYTALEARVLDLALVLHMEHGGGNNSTFTTHVVTSSGTDTYSAITAALGSLKGPKHGGANIKVVQMMNDLERSVSDRRDEEEVAAYLRKLLKKEAFDRSGLIYGMGHAVYTKSDPRALILRSYVEALSAEKGKHEEYELYSMIETLAPEVIAGERTIYKGVSANVDFYSGFIYNMLGIPEELYTPIFAIARIVGWSAHRLEELINVNKIIRPTYKGISEERAYKAMSQRTDG